jgi:hypothetical protein
MARWQKGLMSGCGLGLFGIYLIVGGILGSAASSVLLGTFYVGPAAAIAAVIFFCQKKFYVACWCIGYVVSTICAILILNALG